MKDGGSPCRVLNFIGVSRGSGSVGVPESILQPQPFNKRGELAQRSQETLRA